MGKSCITCSLHTVYSICIQVIYSYGAGGKVWLQLHQFLAIGYILPFNALQFALRDQQSEIKIIQSNRKAMNRNWSNQKANPALKAKAGNKYYK